MNDRSQTQCDVQDTVLHSRNIVNIAIQKITQNQKLNNILFTFLYKNENHEDQNYVYTQQKQTNSNYKLQHYQDLFKAVKSNQINVLYNEDSNIQYQFNYTSHTLFNIQLENPNDDRCIYIFHKANQNLIIFMQVLQQINQQMLNDAIMKLNKQPQINKQNIYSLIHEYIGSNKNKQFNLQPITNKLNPIINTSIKLQCLEMSKNVQLCDLFKSDQKDLLNCFIYLDTTKQIDSEYLLQQILVIKKLGGSKLFLKLMIQPANYEMNSFLGQLQQYKAKNNFEFNQNFKYLLYIQVYDSNKQLVFMDQNLSKLYDFIEDQMKSINDQMNTDVYKRLFNQQFKYYKNSDVIVFFGKQLKIKRLDMQDLMFNQDVSTVLDTNKQKMLNNYCYNNVFSDSQSFLNQKVNHFNCFSQQHIEEQINIYKQLTTGKIRHSPTSYKTFQLDNQQLLNNYYSQIFSFCQMKEITKSQIKYELHENNNQLVYYDSVFQNQKIALLEKYEIMLQIENNQQQRKQYDIILIVNNIQDDQLGLLENLVNEIQVRYFHINQIFLIVKDLQSFIDGYYQLNLHIPEQYYTAQYFKELFKEYINLVDCCGDKVDTFINFAKQDTILFEQLFYLVDIQEGKIIYQSQYFQQLIKVVEELELQVDTDKRKDRELQSKLQILDQQIRIQKNYNSFAKAAQDTIQNTKQFIFQRQLLLNESTSDTNSVYNSQVKLFTNNTNDSIQYENQLCIIDDFQL